MGEVAATNRRARFPAAQSCGVLRIASAPDLARSPERDKGVETRQCGSRAARRVRRDLGLAWLAKL